MNQYEDKDLACSDCRRGFVWGAGEQEFMQGLFRDGKIDKITPPLRCVECRASRKLHYHFYKLYPGRKYASPEEQEEHYKEWFSALSEEDMDYIISRR